MGVSEKGCSLSSLMILATVQPVLQERKQPQDENLLQVGICPKLKCWQRSAGTPQNILINLQVLCKTKWEEKNHAVPWPDSAGGPTGVKSVRCAKTPGRKRMVRYFRRRWEPFSETHNLVDLARISQNNFPSGILVVQKLSSNKISRHYAILG